MNVWDPLRIMLEVGSEAVERMKDRRPRSMGTDIHMYTEQYVQGAWHFAREGPFSDRIYRTFYLLAGVRGYDEVIHPIAKGRGLPEDRDLGEEAEAALIGADHSFSWALLSEIDAFVSEHGDRSVGVRYSQAGQEVYQTAEELFAWRHTARACLVHPDCRQARELGLACFGPDDATRALRVRFVFGFDS